MARIDDGMVEELRSDSGFWRRLEGRRFVRQTNRHIERGRVAPFDAIAAANRAPENDPAIQT